MVDEPKLNQFIGQIPGNLAGADNEVITVLILAPDSTSHTPAGCEPRDGRIGRPVRPFGRHTAPRKETENERD
jgi:hypothetical protein